MNAFQFIQSIGKNPQFATLILETVPKIVKEKTVNSKYIGLKKVSYRLVILNFIYSNSVRNEFVREGIDPDLFEGKGRTNGLVYYPNSKCLLHSPDKTKDYIWCKVEKDLETRYFLHDKEIPAEELNGILYEPKPASTQDPIEKKIVCRNILLSNLLAIKANNELFLNS